MSLVLTYSRFLSKFTTIVEATLTLDIYMHISNLIEAMFLL